MDWHTILGELTYKTSRSSGPGGQHVNRTETKVELRFEIRNSKGLSPQEIEMISNALSSRINEDGVLSLTSQVARSQLANKELVNRKLLAILTKAIRPVKKRKPTRPTRQSVDDRLSKKKQLSEKKESRKKPGT